MDIEDKNKMAHKCRIAVDNAKKILKVGDRVRCSKCPGTKRTFTFKCWDGEWIVSKSGIDDFHPINIDRLNGVDIDFTKTDFYAPNENEKLLVDFLTYAIDDTRRIIGDCDFNAGVLYSNDSYQKIAADFLSLRSVAIIEFKENQ